MIFLAGQNVRSHHQTMNLEFVNALLKKRLSQTGCMEMRRSRLELYEEVICTLAKKALTIDSLAFECNTNCVLLQEQLDFLVTNDIVSIEISRNNKAFYVLTRRGLAISKTFGQAKILEKLQAPQNSVSSLEITSTFHEYDKEKSESRM